MDPAEAKRSADALWAELKTPELRATRMFELTRNPLMLSVLCAVYRERGSLPTRRVELYEQCLQVLVRQWCSKGALPRRFGDREARQILQPLAHWLHEERGRTHADGRSIAAMLEPHLVASLGHEPIDGEAFLRAVATDDGILAAKGGQSFGLLHPCFQEYLCARHLRSLSHGDSRVLDELADRVGDPWWREVTILLLALGEPALFEPLMERVVRRPAFAESLDLVLDCFHDAAGASVGPFEALLRCPPTNEPELWPRQLVAAQVLEKVDPERLLAIAPLLCEHPYAPLRRLVGHDEGSERAIRISPRSGYTLVEIPAGRFEMGSHPRERGRRGGEGPRHEVELDGFFMGKQPVTNEDYGYYLRANPQAPEPAYWADSRYNHPRQPVVGVSWHEANAYCEWAGLSLPTEAQWERACRGGTQTAYWSGREEHDLARVGWYAGNSEQRLHVVGEREPNPFGLHDVHGNVWEWCLDDFGDYEGSLPRPSDGLRHEPLAEGNRIIRGGSWIDSARKARAASRLNRHPDNRLAYLGFRAVERREPDEG
jgi:formylglycine-generating enzyme required for sulfatase activity